MEPAGSSSSKLERRVVEKNRRVEMTQLYSKLASLIPNPPSQERMPVRGMLDQATNYVVQLKQHVEELEQKKSVLQGQDSGGTEKEGADSVVPDLSVRDTGSTLEVNFMNGLNKSFILPQVLSVLEEEGAEILNISYSTKDDKIFYTILSKALYPRIGVETSRVEEKLKKLLL